MRILCVHIETSSLWAEFVNKNRCISGSLVSKEVKRITFPMTRIFHYFFFMWKMDPMSGFNFRLVFTLPRRDSTLQYKRCVHLWNNFSCIITLYFFLAGNLGENAQRWKWNYRKLYLIGMKHLDTNANNASRSEFKRTFF